MGESTAGRITESLRSDLEVGVFCFLEVCSVLQASGEKEGGSVARRVLQLQVFFRLYSHTSLLCLDREM